MHCKYETLLHSYQALRLLRRPLARLLSCTPVRHCCYALVRWIYGLLAGPPCETWTIAREQALQQSTSRHPPRKLRDRDSPWGFDSLSLRELHQLAFGNGLLSFTAESLAALYTSQGVGIMEHPATPDNSEAASVWRTPLFCLLRRLPGFALHRLHQGLHGAPSAKPTELLTLRLGHVAKRLGEWQVSDRMPQGASIGLDSAGCFRTTVLKEYPPSLCAALSAAVMHSLRPSAFTEEAIPDDFLHRCKAMKAEYSLCIGKDFAG